MPTINRERMLNDLTTLRSFGATGNGVVRTTYSEIDMEARRWLATRMREAGLEATIDGVGNVMGRSPNEGKAVLVGSHSDTQLTGGWLDGAMGVIYALEVARTLLENEATAHLPVDVVSWADEESSYLSVLGSRSFCGLLSEDEVNGAIGRDGRPLLEAWEACGLTGRSRLTYDPARHAAFVEAHIEQGPYLELEKKRIGVVSSIVGARTFDISTTGQQNHAGTTPMVYRQDAGMQLIRLGNLLNERIQAVCGEKTVWTIGQISFEPNRPSIVPGKATMSWQFRDPSEAKLDEIQEMTEQTVAEFGNAAPVSVHLAPKGTPPRAAAMDDGLRAHLAASAEKHCPGEWVHMPSGAVHDAQILAKRMPAVMLFIPSIDGISHSFAEDSHIEDIVLGCQVLTDGVAGMVRELGSK